MQDGPQGSSGVPSIDSAVGRAERDAVGRAERDAVGRAERDAVGRAERDAKERLQAIDDAPLEEHVEVYEDVHRRLQEGLADLDEN
jgi:hypothetical protein